MLYLVASPIGNLGDITLRALEVLKTSHYILCEDTRHSAGLLSHYGIQAPLRSYHKFNELVSLDGIMEDLHIGKQIALISDAGTPTISDPGFAIVKRAREEKIPVYSLPGPCAAIAALSISGLPSDRFQFFGFLPKKANELRNVLIELLHYPGISICYESPHRIVDTLKKIYEVQPNLKITILRELTKYHEEYLTGSPQELLSHFEKHTPLGEIVLLFEGTPQDTQSSLSPEEHVRQLQENFGITLTEAIKLAAHLRNVPKRTIYNQLHVT